MNPIEFQQKWTGVELKERSAAQEHFLDRAVWGAYGWDDPDPAAVDEDTILSRLLVVNGERAGISR